MHPTASQAGSGKNRKLDEVSRSRRSAHRDLGMACWAVDADRCCYDAMGSLQFEA